MGSTSRKKPRKKSTKESKAETIEESKAEQHEDTMPMFSSSNFLQEWVMEGYTRPASPENLKSQYQSPSEQELRKKRKEERKQLKKEAAALQRTGLPGEELANNNKLEVDKEEKDDKENTCETSKTTLHDIHKDRNKRLRSYHVQTIKAMFKAGGYTLDTVQEVKEDSPIVDSQKFCIRRGGDLFREIMEESYNGELEPIINLIKSRFGGKAYLNAHKRWHFSIPHINKQHAVFWNLLDPQREL